MNIAETLHNSWHIIGRNKVRSFLTMLGITIGIMSVIIISSVGSGAQSLILNQIKGMGSNLIGVLPGKSDEKGPPASVFGISITTLKEEDGEALMNSGWPHFIAFSGYVRGIDTVSWSDNQTDTNFVGVNSAYTTVEDVTIAKGRFFTDEEDHGLSRVAVLGSEVADDLFGDLNPLGEKIKIKKVNFTIIGVVSKRGVSGFQNQDNQIFVPLQTAQKFLLGINHVSYMRLKVDEAQNVNPGIEFSKDILRDRHNISNPENDDFSVRSMAQGLEVMTQVTNALKLFLVAVAAIALIVGGIGIMNIMLAAVQERTKEIGLRKAVGAKNHHILQQFLVETSLITSLAGLLGIILGVLISYLVAVVAKKLGYSWDFVVSPMSIVFGCFVSVGIGLIFGILPARKASKLDPIEALRYE